MKPPMVSVNDYAVEAHKILPRNALDYYQSGALQEITLHENKEAINRYVQMVSIFLSV